MATVEYVALVILVSIALAVGAVVADDGIAEAVERQMRRALCIVSGGFCDDDEQPCVVRSDERSKSTETAVTLGRLRDGRSVRVDQLSDGTVSVSVEQSNALGLEVAKGGHVRLRGQRGDTEVSAQVSGEAASVRRYVVDSPAAARRLVDRLNETDAKIAGGVRGVVDFFTDDFDGDERERGVAFSMEAQAAAVLGVLGLDAVAEAAAKFTGGVTVDGLTGARTITLKRDREVTAEISAAVAGLGMGLSRETSVAFSFDRDWRPTALTIRATGGVRGSASFAGAESSGGDRGEAEARLDLTDPALAALGRRILHGDVRAAAALAGHVRRYARVDVRHYATDHDEDSSGINVGAMGIELGHERATATDRARLVGAWTRSPGRGWTRRTDCLQSAGIAAPS